MQPLLGVVGAFGGGKVRMVPLYVSKNALRHAENHWQTSLVPEMEEYVNREVHRALFGSVVALGIVIRSIGTIDLGLNQRTKWHFVLLLPIVQPAHLNNLSA